jgi:hypothetical protein
MSGDEESALEMAVGSKGGNKVSSDKLVSLTARSEISMKISRKI